MSFVTQIVLGLLILSMGISIANRRLRSPLLCIANRWLRWFLFAFTVAAAAREFGWSERPYWVLAAVAFLGWFLLETLYNWLEVCAVSKSPIPLFPRFRRNTEGDEWPADKRFILLRDWLRSTGFKKLESMKADLIQDYVIRSSVYQDEQGLVRLQVIFFPQGLSNYEVSYVLITKTEEGERVMTTNLTMPFGGFYPEKWFIVRKPLMRKLDKMLRFHRRRLLREGVNVQLWEDDPVLDDLNRQQTSLEIANLQSGYLLPNEFQEEHGRLSFDGRYRLWKEHWLINYLGRTVGY